MGSCQQLAAELNGRESGGLCSLRLFLVVFSLRVKIANLEITNRKPVWPERKCGASLIYGVIIIRWGWKVKLLLMASFLRNIAATKALARGRTIHGEACVTYWQFQTRVCFSATLSELIFPISLLLSAVHPSNNVEATLPNATSRTILSAKSNVASTLLLVWTALKGFSFESHRLEKCIPHNVIQNYRCIDRVKWRHSYLWLRYDLHVVGQHWCRIWRS